MRHLAELWEYDSVEGGIADGVVGLLEWIAHMDGAEIQEVLVEFPTYPDGPKMRVAGTWLVPDASWHYHQSVCEECLSMYYTAKFGGLSPSAGGESDRHIVCTIPGLRMQSGHRSQT